MESSTSSQPAAARTLLRQLITIYMLASFAAVAVVLGVVALGLEFSAYQWLVFLVPVPVMMLFYTVIDIVLIVRHFRPLGAALEAIESAHEADPQRVGAGIVRALNLPYYSFLRVTFVHGPLATLTVLVTLLGANAWLDAGYATWQIVSFGIMVLCFASPAHAVYEYFAITQRLVEPIQRLWRHCPDLPLEQRRALISVRLKQKLGYLAIFIAILPLVFFGAYTVVKTQLVLEGLDIAVTLDQLTPLIVWIVGVIVVCGIGVVTMSMLTATDVSRSAARLVEAMNRVENGDLSETLYITGTDEYADIFRGFNLMTESLRDEVRILEVSHDLAGEIHLDVLLERIMGAVTELLDADRSTLFLYDADSDTLWSRFASGIESTEIRFPADQGIAGSVLRSQRTESIADPYADPRFNPAVDRDTGYRTHSILCAPITSKSGQAIGVTQVLNKHGGAFTSKDESRLLAFTAQISVSLENARLFEDVLSMKNYNDSILQSTSNGMITLDRAQRVVTANEAARRILKVDAGVLIGAAADQVFGAANAWLVRSIGRAQASGETDVSVDADVVLGDGESVSANISVLPLRDSASDIIGTIVVMEDITGEKRVKSTMARYMSKEVVDQLLAGGDAMMGGNDQLVTVLFSDVRGFTTTSESLGARETVSMLNEYFEEMVDVIFRHNGILDKYIGDAIMALFGAPFAGPHDADDALSVANDMMTSLRALNARRTLAGRAPIDIGIGISTGMVVAGNIGSPKRMEYTVIGDSVNLASRLEGANKFYGTTVLLSEHTVAELQHPVLLRQVDLMRVKGKDQPVAVYESLGYHTDETYPGLEQALAVYQQGLERYRARDWLAAGEAFEQVTAIHPGDRPAQIYLERCRHYRATPPGDDWDGVWTLTEK